MPDDQTLSPLTRLQAKEAIRLAYVSGRARLVELAELHGIPYDTVRFWSTSDGWTVERDSVLVSADAKTVSVMAQLLTDERERQIRRALQRSGGLRDAIDAVLREGDVAMTEVGPIRIPIGAKALQSIATAEERADLISRRNLGMDDQGGGSTNVSVNVLGTVQIG